jgi:TonB family protein
MLERYDLRARINADDEFHFLIESESLLSRLKRELVNAVEELRENPRSFLGGLLRGEGSTRQRKRLIQAGFATALIAYSSIIMATLLAGLFRQTQSDQIVIAAPKPLPTPFIIAIPIATSKADQQKRAAKARQGLLGGSLQQSQAQRSGGGGGQEDKRPASVGEMPMPALSPQLNPPDLEPPKIKFATLIVPETIYADDALRQRINGQFGIRNGQTDAPSRGDGKGTGIGEGDGPGYDRGIGGNVGGGPPRIGSGPIKGSGDGVLPMSQNLRPTILYREKAKYTENARQNRVQGAVVLSVIFGADGKIHNIRVVRGLPHGLTETSIEAAQHIRFQPAIHNSRPVSVQATLEFNFALY